MGHVNFLKSWSSHSSLLRHNVFNCWGSSKKVRNSPKLFWGFSSTLALTGFGLQAFKNYLDAIIWNLDTARSSQSTLRLQAFKHISLEKFPVTKQKLENGGLALVNLVRQFTFLTPVLCSGVDFVCNCADKKPPCEMTLVNSEHKCDESCENRKKTGSTSPVGKTSNVTPPSSKCSTTKKRSCGPVSTSNTPVSQTGSNDVEIDVEALSAKLGLKQIDWIEKSDLSHCFLLRQASQVTVDSVTRILTETASAYEDYHLEYRRLLELLVDALEASRRACGADLEVVECKIVLIRAKVDEMKRRIQDVEMFLGSLDKLANASAETAFMANAEYASIAVSERLHSLNLEVKRLRDETKEKERDMLELQALIIVESGKSLK